MRRTVSSGKKVPEIEVTIAELLPHAAVLRH